MCRGTGGDGGDVGALQFRRGGIDRPVNEGDSDALTRQAELFERSKVQKINIGLGRDCVFSPGRRREGDIHKSNKGYQGEKNP